MLGAWVALKMINSVDSVEHARTGVESTERNEKLLCTPYILRDSHVNLCSDARRQTLRLWDRRGALKRVKVQVKNVANLHDKTFHHFQS